MVLVGGSGAAPPAGARELTCSVVPVEDGESEEGAVTVGGEGGFGQRGQVVHVVEARAVRVVVARQQQVHVVRSLEQQADGSLHPESCVRKQGSRHTTGEELGGSCCPSKSVLGSVPGVPFDCGKTLKDRVCIQIFPDSFKLTGTSLEVSNAGSAGGGDGVLGGSGTSAHTWHPESHGTHPSPAPAPLNSWSRSSRPLLSFAHTDQLFCVFSSVPP